MESSPWEANSSVNKYIFRRLCNLEFYLSVHKGPPPVPIMSQMNQVYTLQLSSLGKILLSSI
jgi:hypothetical protein